MTNASRTISREMKRNWHDGNKHGISQGIAMMAKKLKDKMSTEEISQLTGLSEQQIENL